MTSPQATTLLDRLVAAFAYGRFLIPVQATLYLKALTAMEFDAASEAVGRLIATRETFPKIATLWAVYKATRGERVEHGRKAEQRPDVPMSPAERREAGQGLVDAAIARREQGRDDHWASYFEEIGDLYATNAERQETGKPLLPIPKLSALLRKMASVGRLHLPAPSRSVLPETVVAS